MSGTPSGGEGEAATATSSSSSKTESKKAKSRNGPVYKKHPIDLEYLEKLRDSGPFLPSKVPADVVAKAQAARNPRILTEEEYKDLITTQNLYIPFTSKGISPGDILHTQQVNLEDQRRQEVAALNLEIKKLKEGLTASVPLDVREIDKAMASDLADSKKLNAELHDELAQERSESKKVNAILLGTKTVVDKLQNQVESLEAELQEEKLKSQNPNRASRIANEKTKKELERYKEQCKKHEDHISYLEKQLVTHGTKGEVLEKSRASQERLQRQLAAKTNDLDAANNELKALSDQINDLTQQNKNEQRKIADLRMKVDTSTEEIKEAWAENGNVSTLLRKEQDKNGELLVALKTFEADMQEAALETFKYQAALDELAEGQKQREMLKLEVAHLNDELDARLNDVDGGEDGLDSNVGKESSANAAGRRRDRELMQTELASPKAALEEKERQNTELSARLQLPMENARDSSQVNTPELSTKFGDMEERAVRAERDLAMKEAELAVLQVKMDSYGERSSDGRKNSQESEDEIPPPSKATEEALEIVREGIRKTYNEKGMQGLEAWLITETGTDRDRSEDGRRRSATTTEDGRGRSPTPDGGGRRRSATSETSVSTEDMSGPRRKSFDTSNTMSSWSSPATVYSSLVRHNTALHIIPEEQTESAAAARIDESDVPASQPEEPHGAASPAEAFQSLVTPPSRAANLAPPDLELDYTVPAISQRRQSAGWPHSSQSSFDSATRQASPHVVGSFDARDPTAAQRARSVRFLDSVETAGGDHSNWLWWLAVLLVTSCALVAAAADTERRRWIVANQQTSAMFYAMSTGSEKAAVFRWLFGWALEHPYEGVVMGMYG